MKRIAAFLWIALCAAPAFSQSSFLWQHDSRLDGELAYGTLSPIVDTAPQELGSNGFLDSEDLVTSADLYTPQLSFVTTLSSSVEFSWILDGLTVSTPVSVLIRHSPFGLRPPAALAIAPGVLGLLVEWPAGGWGSWGFSVAGGRIELRDPAGVLVNQLVDGVAVEAGTDAVYLSAAAGFTGLLEKFFYTPRIVAADSEQFSDPQSYFAQNRLLSQIRVEAALPASQRLALFGLLYQGLDDPLSSSALWTGLSGTGTLVRFGAPPVLDELGPNDDWPDPVPGGGLSHSTTAIVLLRFDGSSPALFLTTQLSALLPDSPIGIELGATYASGGAELGTYTPATPFPQGRVIAVPAQNLLKFDTAFTLFASAVQPAIQPRVGVSVYLLPDPPAGTSPFLGVEGGGGLVISLLTDLRLAADAGLAFSPLGLTPFLTLTGSVEL